MFNQLRNYQVDFLKPHASDGISRSDQDGGYYHHKLVMVGEGEADVVRQIRELGGIPVSIKPTAARFWSSRSISRQYKEQFLMAIFFSCSTMSAAKALESVIESSTGQTREHLNQAYQIVKRGGSFGEAIEATNFFDESTLAILVAGERTGTLRESIQTAVEHLQSRAKQGKLMLGVAAFTVFELLIAFISLVGNRMMLLPSLEKNMPQNAPPAFLETLKAATENAYLINDIMIWGTVAIVLAGTAGFFAYFDKNKRFRRWIDSKVMAIPILNKAILHSSVSNSFKVASSLLKGGTTLFVMMDIAEKSTRVPTVMDYWQEAMRRIESGDTVALALCQPILDNTDQLLLSAHTDRHQLSQTFATIAEKRNALAEKAAKNFGVISFLVTSAYIMVASSIALYILYLQNSSLMTGMQSM